MNKTPQAYEREIRRLNARLEAEKQGFAQQLEEMQEVFARQIAFKPSVTGDWEVMAASTVGRLLKKVFMIYHRLKGKAVSLIRRKASE